MIHFVKAGDIKRGVCVARQIHKNDIKNIPMHEINCFQTFELFLT